MHDLLYVVHASKIWTNGDSILHLMGISNLRYSAFMYLFIFFMSFFDSHLFGRLCFFLCFLFLVIWMTDKYVNKFTSFLSSPLHKSNPNPNRFRMCNFCNVITLEKINLNFVWGIVDWTMNEKCIYHHADGACNVYLNYELFFKQQIQNKQKIHSIHPFIHSNNIPSLRVIRIWLQFSGIGGLENFS